MTDNTNRILIDRLTGAIDSWRKGDVEPFRKIYDGLSSPDDLMTALVILHLHSEILPVKPDIDFSLLSPFLNNKRVFQS